MSSPKGARATGLVAVVVVDDDDVAREDIARLLEGEPDMRVVARCRDGHEAIATIERLRPDLLFLDVQMPGLDGLDVLARLSMNPLPEAVLLTANDPRAIRGFDAHALDYLVKPIDAARFGRALDRARRELRDPRRAGAARRLAAFLAASAELAIEPSALLGRPSYLKRFLVKTGATTVVLRASDVDRIEAAGNYVRLHVGARSYVVRQAISRLERSLDPAAFVRVHRSTLVNLACVGAVEAHAGHDYIVRLTNGTRVRMSRSYREEFERRMGSSSA